jgi:hypothetical protein
MVMSTAVGRAEVPLRGPAEVEAALAERAKDSAQATATSDIEARDELRLHLARLRLGMVEGCNAHPRIQGYAPIVPGYTCQTLRAPTAAALDARELAGEVVSPSDELRFFVGTCLQPRHTPGYGA